MERAQRSRAASADEEVVEESIEYQEDDDLKSLAGGLSLQRHTRSHYDLHSKKDTRGGRSSHSNAPSLRAPILLLVAS